MTKVILYIAMSLDSYIADINRNVSWLCGDGSDENHPGTYDDFIKTVGTIILGNTTYNQIVTELSPEIWPYTDHKTYVLSSQDSLLAKKSALDNIYLKDKDIEFVNQKAADFIFQLKRKEKKNIWICGGANVVMQLLEAKLIDIFHISVIPTLLGKGIRLFPELNTEQQLKLISTCHYNGIVDLVYKYR